MRIVSSALLAVLFTLGMASSVWAACPNVVNATTPYTCTQTVYNDSGSDLTSGSVVIWQNDGAGNEFDQLGNPYVTTTTSEDDDWVAGVLEDNLCRDASLCSMVYHGWTYTRIRDSSDAVAEDTLVATSASAGLAGDYAPADNTCSLGLMVELRDRWTGTDVNSDFAVYPVWVNINCR